MKSHYDQLPAWVIGDQPEDVDSELERASEADPALALAAGSLRATQLRAMEVIGRTDIPQSVAPAAHPAAPSNDNAPEPDAANKPGRTALFVALVPGVIAVVLASVVLTTLGMRNTIEPPVPVTEQLTLVTNGSLAPLALEDAEQATRSLMALGVSQRAATPPDLTVLDMHFLRATALPGDEPGAAFEYRRGESVVLLQTAQTLTAPSGSDIRPYRGTPVYWASVGTRAFAIWPESGVYRAMTIDSQEDELREIVHGWLDLPGVL